MPIEVDFGNPDNWELKLTRRFAPFPLPDDDFRAPNRFAPFTPPVILNSPILNIRTDSITAKRTWHFAGRVRRVLHTAFSPTPQLDDLEDRRELVLFRRNLLKWTDYQQDYALQFEIPFYIEDIEISVWEYTGLIRSREERLLEDLCLKVQELLEGNPDQQTTGNLFGFF